MAGFMCKALVTCVHLTQETRVYNVENDVADIIYQALVTCLHVSQETRVYNVENDVAGSSRHSI